MKRRKKQTRTKGWSSRKLPGAPACESSWDVTVIDWKYGAGKQGFPHAKECLPKLSSLWALALKKFRQPCCVPKKFKEEFTGRHVFRLPRAPACLRLTLETTSPFLPLISWKCGGYLRTWVVWPKVLKLEKLSLFCRSFLNSGKLCS
jgi:hypothetical protein